MEEIVLLQMNMWSQLRDLDVQELHNLCSYPETDLIGIEPGPREVE